MTLQSQTQEAPEEHDDDSHLTYHTEENEESTIETKVIATIVRHTALAVPGVAEIGHPSMGRSIRNTFTGKKNTQGVEILTGNRARLLDINITVNSGHRIPDVMNTVRADVKKALHYMCDIDDTIINVKVTDIVMQEGDPAKRALID